MIEITAEMLEAAMCKAVELNAFPEKAILTAYLQNWKILEEILKAALEKLEDD